MNMNIYIHIYIYLHIYVMKVLGICLSQDEALESANGPWHVQKPSKKWSESQRP